MPPKRLHPSLVGGLELGLDLRVCVVGHFSEGVLVTVTLQALLYHCFAYLARCTGKVVALLRPNEVAQMLAVSRAWVYEAARSGRIPSVRIGGEDGPLRFVPEDLDRWLAEARAQWLPTASWPTRRTSVEPRGGRSRSRRRSESKAQVVDQQSLL